MSEELKPQYLFYSAWEFKCYYFPDDAMSEYKDSLDSGELGSLLANVSLNNLVKKKRQEYKVIPKE